MLERTEHEGGVVTYQSPLLREWGIVHGFSTRLGGVSPEPYASLNLGPLVKGVGDANTSISENYRRLRRALGLERRPRAEVRQVHGWDVWLVEGRPVRLEDAPRADALVTADATRMLTIRTADCVPVLLASRDGRAVGAVHAGWRGVVAGVVEATVRAMRERLGVDAAELLGTIGPCIGGEAFEVGPEVVAAFDAAGLKEAKVPDGEDGKPRLDLRAAVRLQLLRAGMAAELIDTTDRCTYRDAEAFFSHRRDVTHHGRRDTGRMAAVIVARAGDTSRAFDGMGMSRGL